MYQIQCVTCKQELKIDENALGKKVRCPKCKEIFTATSSSAANPLPPIVARPPTPAATPNEAATLHASPRPTKSTEKPEGKLPSKADSGRPYIPAPSFVKLWWFYLNRSSAGVIGVLCPPLAFFFWALMAVIMIYSYWFSVTSTPIIGTVTKKTHFEFGRRSTARTVEYDYTTPDGTTRHGSSVYPSSKWDGLREKGPINLRYQTFAPDQTMAQDHLDASLDPRWFCLACPLGLVLLVLGAIVDIPAWHAIRRLKHGTPAVGRVVALVPKRRYTEARRNNIVFSKCLKYQFEPTPGKLVTGLTPFLSDGDAEYWQEGDPILVLFNNNNPYANTADALGYRQDLASMLPPKPAKPTDDEQPFDFERLKEL